MQSRVPADRDPLRLDAALPGGNVILDRVEGDCVYVRQDLRDTEGWWFYWHFRVCGAAGRALRFHFTNGDVLGTRGPAVSVDAGRTWTWLGRGPEPGFAYTFAPDADEVRFSFAVPYLETDLHAFLGRHRGHPALRLDTLCRTAKGRAVERLHVGRLDGRCRQRVVLTARHHACESMADYALEGVLEAILSDTEDGRWYRENVELLAVPFVDKDGVEDGDQGKNRRPHDHNRDYLDPSVHASVAALRGFIPEWSAGRVRVALDLHCPWIRGEYNEFVYFTGQDNARQWQRLCAFSALLERTRSGPLPYAAGNNLPFGKAWNTAANYTGGRSFDRWAMELPGMDLAATIEIPYANVGEHTVTPDAVRAFGRDLARALRRFLAA